MAKEHTARFVETVRILAMAAMEMPPEARDVFMNRAIARTRQVYAHVHGTDPAAEEQADRILILAKEMVSLIEETGGGPVGYA